MNTSPRFLITDLATKHGTRDEVIGTKTVVLATAETRGWANHLSARLAPSADFINITDTAPAPILDPAPTPADITAGTWF